MLGIRYLKVPSTTYVLHYKKGKIKSEGAGLSFFYYAPSSVISLIPISASDAPFVFNEITADFQEVTVQGSINFRVADPKKLASLLDYTTDTQNRYVSDDPTKLQERLVQATQVRTRGYIMSRTMRNLLAESSQIETEVLEKLRTSETLGRLGVEILDLAILSLRPSPEMNKALQAETRETMLKQADEAIYSRRNASVEQERKIKENELQTELAVAAKKRLIRESQMAADVAVEQQRAVLVDARAENERKEAEVKATSLRAVLEPLKDIDWRTLIAAGGGADSQMMISMAFDQLAQNAQKIGELNISPDLLNSLLSKKNQDS